MSRLVRVVFALAIVVPLRAQSPPPAPQATFHGGTDLVQVDVSVLDSHRRPVRGLIPQDFTVFEDGQPREIQAFTEVYLPDRLQRRDAAWTHDVPSDVATNQTAQEEGRLVVIVLDRTIPLGEPEVAARRIAAAAVNQLGPGDLAAVVSTNNGAVQNLTSDRTRLLRAINASDLASDISDKAKEIEADVFALTGRTWSTLNDGRCQCGLCVLDTITRVADAVQSADRRRKVMLFIGSDLLLQSGPQAPINDVGCENRLRDARDRTFAAIDRAHLTVHSIDPLGLVNVSPAARASSPLKGNSLLTSAVTGATSDNLKRQGNLEVLPSRTGGRTVMNTNGPDLAVPEIFRESESYYLIGFRPGTRSDGQFHRISVKATRKGLDVRARSGYAAASSTSAVPPAPNGPLTEPMREALTGLLPAGATPIDLNAATFAVPGTQKGAVVLTVGVGAFAPDASNGAKSESNGEPLEVVATALDPGGRPKGVARQTLSLSWPSVPAGSTPRLDALTRLDLAPGEYEIRLGVTGAARTASVFSYVTIPSYAAAPLSLSSIIVGATPGTLTAPKDFLSQLLPIVPTTRREFSRSDRLVAFVRIYQGTARTDPLSSVQLTSTIVDGAGAVVASQTGTLNADQFGDKRTVDHYLSVPLASLAPGDYLVKVETTMGPRVAGRAMRFVVKE
jgi:VWFA-related protein